MRSSHNFARVETTFDHDNVVPNGGLLALAALAQKLGVESPSWSMRGFVCPPTRRDGPTAGSGR